jgi:hypothetical protein
MGLDGSIPSMLQPKETAAIRPKLSAYRPKSGMFGAYPTLWGDAAFGGAGGDSRAVRQG